MKKRLGFLLTTGLLVPAISCSNQSINAQKVMHTHNRLSETNKNQNKAKSASENDDKNNSKSVDSKITKDANFQPDKHHLYKESVSQVQNLFPSFKKTSYQIKSLDWYIHPKISEINFYNINGINYVSIDDFLKISDGIIDIDKSYHNVNYQSKFYNLHKKIEWFYKDNIFAINSINKYNSSSDNSLLNKSHSLKFDYQNQQLTLSSYGFLDSILPIESEHNLRFIIQNESLINDTPVVIDLKKYGIKMEMVNGKILLPFAVLNQLILAESSYQFYFNNDEILIFSFYQLHNPENLEYRKKLSSGKLNKELSKNLKEFQFKFLHFLFDNFYGIKGKDQNWALKLLEKHKSHLLESDEQHYKTVHKIINSLDDLHTKLFMNGYNQTESQYDNLNNEFNDTSRIKEYWKLYFQFRKMASRPTNNFITTTLTPDNKTLIVRFDALINGITDYLSPILDEYKSKGITNVVLDFSNMLGGSLYAVFELMGFLTNKSFDYKLINPQSGSKKVMKIQSKTFKKDFKFFLLTSPITYSSGNLFAGIVKDNKIAKIIGFKAAGGASYLKMSVLPTGNIIVLSSNNVFANKKFDSYENGVTPDIEFPKNNDGSNNYKKLFDASFIQDIVNRN
ncbi:peptidase S41 [Mycoplasma bovis]|uniref:S41 family peptidase n=1 Tax=Mycoplasmopsis bovis TaxID=28903 RepID=UPI001BDE2E95|nr:S41 family peptidase [Mycoplasmopsis bovis]MBT1345014.1 peptidase S41 [Mycoplasmopsis bovis]MBT1418498.1 peptidase S41 [Mycoplasmopsis bovis]UJB24953.1 peptidase S41 [Mycoplasmopsis bovis]